MATKTKKKDAMSKIEEMFENTKKGSLVTLENKSTYCYSS